MELEAQVLKYLQDHAGFSIHYSKIASALEARDEDVLRALQALGMQVIESQTHKGAWRWASWV